tara:strand:- start:2999 stop:3730 length:732 start_codon:yes stop_codon:yes gene_type:complete
MEITKNKILNGELSLYQPKDGFRFGMDSILLYASISNYVNCIEFGSGVGVVLLSLAKRFPKSRLVGIEKDNKLISLAEKNAKLNNLGHLNIDYYCLDIKTRKFLLELNNSFDRVVMNPPYFNSSSVLFSKNKYKKNSRYEENIKTWFEAAYNKLKPKGYLNFIFRSDYLNIAMECLSEKWGEIKLFPLWPKKGKKSKLTIIQAKKDSKSNVNLLPGLILHNNDGSYTKTCNDILNNKCYINLN